jgi:hypothetical protein
MKQLIGRAVSEVLFYLGDGVNRPMSHWDWAWLYPVYNWLMDASYRMQIWAGNDAPWQLHNTKDDE